MNGNDTWCTSHSGNIFTIESDYNLSSYEVRLLRYPGLNVVMTRTASKGDNDLTICSLRVGIQWKLVCWDARMEIG